MLRRALAVLALTLALSACGGDDNGPSSTQPAADQPPISFQMQSNAFAHEGEIPVRYTCDGEDISPPLFWEDPPDGTQAFALIMDDPDAPGGAFTHWVYFDIPGEARSLPEAISSGTGVNGTNSFGEAGYSGPCPPQGEQHGYVFTLTALDGTLDLPSGALKDDVVAAMQGRALGDARLIGAYSR